MVVINEEILKKYQMDDCQYYIDGYGETEGTLAFCRAFLNLTDHIPLKLLEGTLTTADCVDELAYRELARQEIAKLNGETPVVVENQKTLEQRVTEAEEKTEFAVSYDEMQSAIVEGVNEV